MSAIDRNRAANERHGGCDGCRALTAEVAALRAQEKFLHKEREEQRQHYETQARMLRAEVEDLCKSRDHAEKLCVTTERELAEVRALLARARARVHSDICGYECNPDCVAFSAFLNQRRDEARRCTCFPNARNPEHVEDCPARAKR